ncbi:hypothetical protein [Desulforhabdus amnigena]|jgi:hypothetical protein|uniref:Uncharacterized protein n=1 Tax=Desulforhabdus amnigena TaxID=40218 RepID=A0A9W6L8Y2_9BACT|nr:hypothetical protein [Desulforhabdus amnigena]GLI36163.1 hypothetical protein DAMNIGENAA_35960 [Desulforhabdus amnigena]
MKNPFIVPGFRSLIETWTPSDLRFFLEVLTQCLAGMAPQAGMNFFHCSIEEVRWWNGRHPSHGIHSLLCKSLSEREAMP